PRPAEEDPPRGHPPALAQLVALGDRRRVAAGRVELDRAAALGVDPGEAEDEDRLPRLDPRLAVAAVAHRLDEVRAAGAKDLPARRPDGDRPRVVDQPERVGPLLLVVDRLPGGV